MYIANPIYDTVFKYMMEDNKVAKKFISAIIGEDILELEFAAQEYVASLEHLTVCHLDFVAQIATPAGYKTVTIELQKAKLATDIMRFRSYLGQQYQNKANTFDAKQQKARQIYCIFLLNHGIGLSQSPVLEVNPSVTDKTTAEALSNRNEFVESLHHRSWIVQLPLLKTHRRNDLEKLLSIFDQDNRSADYHILNVKEEDFTEEYRSIIRRLQQAQATPEVRNTMALEDYFLEPIRENERELAEMKKVTSEQDKVIAEQDEVISEKDKVLSEKDKKIAELERLLKSKQ